MKILFWLVIAFDTAALLLIFVLNMAAARSVGAASAGAALILIVPALIVVGSVLLFTRSTTPVGRGAAFFLAAFPLILLVWMKGVEAVNLAINTDEQGQLAYFRKGPLREIAAAISRNDTATVARLAPTVNLDSRGWARTTLLMIALRQLEDTPKELGSLRALIRAGAGPNVGNREKPLELAIQASDKSGAEPVSLLLEAGADPNAKDNFGMPLFFGGVGKPIPIDVLTTLLDHGADLKARDRNGLTIVFLAAETGNWPAVLLLLQRGTEWKGIRRPLGGETLVDWAEYHQRLFGDSTGVAEVLAYLKSH